MRIAFLEFCGLLLVFFAVTQIIIPVILPKHFNFFWLFGKKKNENEEGNTGDDLRESVRKAVGLKKKTDKVIETVRDKTKANLSKAEKLDSEVENLQ